MGWSLEARHCRCSALGKWIDLCYTSTNQSGDRVGSPSHRMELQRTLFMRQLSITCFLLVGLLALGQIVMGPSVDTARVAFAEEAASDVAPVEPSMHEFMEYVFEPPYKRLKAQLVTEPADRTAFKAIKSDALILAETCNLLIGRPPEAEAAEWVAFSKQVRESGSQLYAAAKNKDAAETRKQWVGMLENCNACHTHFAGGEHMLEP